MMLNYIHPDNLHSVWEFVEQGLDRIHDRSHDRWMNPDIYWMLKVNQYALYIVDDNKGFVILQQTKGWDGIEVHVFCAYIVPGENVMDAAFDEVKKLANGIGAKRVKFQSHRKGWERRAEELGYTTGYREYELEL